MNSTSAPSERSASATASAGTTWPAVPPAAITIRLAIGVPPGPGAVDRAQALSGGDQLGVHAPRPPGHPQPGVGDQPVESQHDRYPGDAQLLADHGQDEVGV